MTFTLIVLAQATFPIKTKLLEELPSTNFVYPDFGVMDASELEQYLNELQKVNNRLHDFPDAFSASPLSDFFSPTQKKIKKIK